jgi:rSAM/selenodomain-associated transferase 2
LHPRSPQAPLISIIIPTYNEANYVEKVLRNLRDLPAEPRFEVIVSDGGSSDQTVEIASSFARIVKAPKGRAWQLNEAAKVAQGDVLFFVHAHMTLPRDALKIIRSKIDHESFQGGGFSNVFTSHNRKIKRLGRLINLRLWNNDHCRNTRFYGDNGIFVRKDTFDALGGFKLIPIMEDYDFSRRLRAKFPTTRISTPPIQLSPRRHVKSGFWKTRFRWVAIKQLYRCGVPPKFLVKLYPTVR